jgi:hypothetical protein
MGTEGEGRHTAGTPPPSSYNGGDPHHLGSSSPSWRGEREDTNQPLEVQLFLGFGPSQAPEIVGMILCTPTAATEARCGQRPRLTVCLLIKASSSRRLWEDPG